MLEQGVIEPSTNPIIPLLITPKRKKKSDASGEKKL
jgi:hypothetical protein